MNVSEKIEDRKQKIEAAQKKIAAEQSKITKWKKELETLQNLEVKELLKEVDLPIEELKKFIKQIAATPTDKL